MDVRAWRLFKVYVIVNKVSLAAQFCHPPLLPQSLLVHLVRSKSKYPHTQVIDFIKWYCACLNVYAYIKWCIFRGNDAVGPENILVKFHITVFLHCFGSILEALSAFRKIAYMVQHNYIDHLQKVISHPKQLTQASKPNNFLIKSQCPQNENFLLDCCGSYLSRKKKTFSKL